MCLILSGRKKMCKSMSFCSVPPIHSSSAPQHTHTPACPVVRGGGGIMSSWLCVLWNDVDGSVSSCWWWMACGLDPDHFRSFAALTTPNWSADLLSLSRFTDQTAVWLLETVIGWRWSSSHLIHQYLLRQVPGPSPGGSVPAAPWWLILDL